MANISIRPGKYPQLADRAWLDWEYREKRRSCRDIAAEVGCSPANVDARLRQFEIPRRGRWERVTRAQQSCERCGESYTPTGQSQKYCSQRCRYGTLICQKCGEVFVAVPEQRSNKNITYKRKFCSETCLRAWQEEDTKRRWINKDGYVVVPNPTFSRRTNKNGYVELNAGVRDSAAWNNGRVLEHRWVMEQRIGRRLYSHEEVHHKNGHRDDNDRFCPVCENAELPQALVAGMLQCPSCGGRFKSNLELWTTSQPKGQRVDDKIAWAREFLVQYGYAVQEPISLA